MGDGGWSAHSRSFALIGCYACHSDSNPPLRCVCGRALPHARRLWTRPSPLLTLISMTHWPPHPSLRSRPRPFPACTERAGRSLPPSPTAHWLPHPSLRPKPRPHDGCGAGSALWRPRRAPPRTPPPVRAACASPPRPLPRARAAVGASPARAPRHRSRAWRAAAAAGRTLGPGRTHGRGPAPLPSPARWLRGRPAKRPERGGGGRGFVFVCGGGARPGPRGGSRRSRSAAARAR